MEISCTIKQGNGYEESWQVFRGEPEEVRTTLVEWFGLGDQADGLPGHEVQVLATKVAHGEHAVATVLGATPISVENTPAEEKPEPKKEKAKGPDHSILIGKLEAAATIDDLKTLWAANKEAFSDADVKAAYKARGNALKSA